MCGGAARTQSLATTLWGLSPRVRGSLLKSRSRTLRAGSIPACARGSLQRPLRSLLCLRSIPACAGEPIIRRSEPNSAKVYPRVCGGAVCVRVYRSFSPGLSPRVRGSPPSLADRARELRSIPACAGEPRSHGVGVALSWVYPRVCGGAGSAAWNAATI